MNRLGKALMAIIERYYEGSQTDFSLANKIQNSEVNRIINGERKEITKDRLKQLVRIVAKHGSDAQVELISGFIFDHIPDEFCNLIDIRNGTGGKRGQPVVAPMDDFDEALETLRTFRNNDAIRSAIIGFAKSYDAVTKQAARAAKSARKS